MVRSLLRLAALALVIPAASCVDVKSSSTPTTPTALGGTAAATILGFAGGWTSASTPGTLPGGCSAFDYRLTPSADGQAGDVTFKATCAGITAEGSGRGVMNGSVLNWTAQGTASRDGLTCPFAFADSTATLEGAAVRLNYRGTICGIPVSGSELMRRS